MGLRRDHRVAEDKRTESTMLDRVARVFVKNENRPMTKQQIVNASQISKSALHTLLYTTRSDAFRSQSGPPGVRGKTGTGQVWC